MASNICASCLRIASRRGNSFSRTIRAPSRFTARSLATTSSRFAEANISYKPLSPSKDAQLRKYSTAVAGSDLNKIHGGAMDTYASYGATEIIYKECAGQAPYSITRTEEDEEIPVLEDGTHLGLGEGWWYSDLGLQPTFTSWTQVTMLHMYLISARFRCFEASVCKTWQQHFIDHFFTDAENRMIVNHDLQARSTRNAYLKDLFLQWRGVLLAYDEGLMRGDAVLASAVWRNLCNANPEVDVRKLAMIVSFMRKSMRDLEAMSDLDLVGGGLKFGRPTDESALVGVRSKMMDLPFEKAPEVALPPAGKKAS